MSAQHVHVFIPELFRPLALWQRDFAFKPEADGVLALLAQAVRQPVPVSGWERTLLHALGMEVSQQLPWAALRYHMDTGQSSPLPLLCADPVVLQTGRDRIVMQPSAPVLPAREVQAVLSGLNRHLAHDGWQLLAPHPERWYLLAAGEALPRALPHTTPISDMGGKNILSCLPQADDKYWQRLQDELQMLLYIDPVNQQRLTGVWFWGEGDMTPARVTPAIVYGGGAVGQVLARHAGCGWLGFPSVLGNETEGAGSPVFLLLDQLRLPALHDDPTAWQLALHNIETGILPMIHAALVKGAVVRVYDCAGSCWECRTLPAWQFWKRKRGRWADFLSG